MTKLQNLLCTAAVTAMALGTAMVAGSSSAQALPFGPATAGLSGGYAPIVGATTIAMTGTPVNLFSGTGALPATATGAASGTLTYSTTVGTTVTNTLAGLFTFPGSSSSTYQFDAASALTVSYSTSGTSTTIGLYLLGSMFNSLLGETATPTSVTITFNKTGTSAYSYSASLANPPAPPPSVPEPVSMALLGAGLAGLGLVRRRKA